MVKCRAPLSGEWRLQAAAGGIISINAEFRYIIRELRSFSGRSSERTPDKYGRSPTLASIDQLSYCHYQGLAKNYFPIRNASPTDDICPGNMVIPIR